jgi:hypothetical protein
MTLETRNQSGAGRVDWVAAISCLVSLVAAGLSFYYSRADRISAEQADARTARQIILSDAIRIEEYDQTHGVAKQNEISMLGGDADQLIQEYRQSRLHLSATLYRLVGQALAYSTTDLSLAETMLDRAATASPGPLEQIQVQRVRGDLAAQRQEPAKLKTAYDSALQLEATLKEPEPAVDAYTRIYRLLDAYLGADRATSPSIRAEFCALADGWSEDLSLVRSSAGSPLVRRQLTRAGATTPAELATTCA